MFPLYTKTFPTDADALRALLNASIQRVFTGAPEAVGVKEKKFPALAHIRLCLDRAKLRENPPPPPRTTGKTSPALSADELEIAGTDLSVGPAKVDLTLRAQNVELNQATDANGEIVLALQRATAGVVEVGLDKAELERAIAAVAKQEAGKQGVSIDDVKLTLRARGSRSVDGEVQLRGRKLFFSTVIRIAATLDLDDELIARVSGLTCKGDGTVGALACGVLAPHLQKLDGRSFPLMALPLGEVRLRDVRLAAGERISVTAEFGS